MSLKKTASIESPHAIFQDARTGWEWHVLKTYKLPKSEAKDQYARWLVAVRSPYTHGGFEMGDEYARNVKRARLVNATPEWLEAYDHKCEWFALCENDAVDVRKHPVLDGVPICRRCADKVDAIAGLTITEV